MVVPVLSALEVCDFMKRHSFTLLTVTLNQLDFLKVYLLNKKTKNLKFPSPFKVH